MPSITKAERLPRNERFPGNSWTCADIAYCYNNSEGEEREYWKGMFNLAGCVKVSNVAKDEPTCDLV